MKKMVVYILLCSDESYYIGVTNDLTRRLIEHNSGFDINCYTYGRRPLELVYKQEFTNPNDAIIFEKRIKNWSRKKKEALINGNINLLKEYSKCRNETSHKNFVK